MPRMPCVTIENSCVVSLQIIIPRERFARKGTAHPLFLAPTVLRRHFSANVRKTIGKPILWSPSRCECVRNNRNAMFPNSRRCECVWKTTGKPILWSSSLCECVRNHRKIKVFVGQERPRRPAWRAKWSPSGAWRPVRRAKWSPSGAWRPVWKSKWSPRLSKRRPRGSKLDSKDVQELPKTLPEAPKTLQEVPKTLQEASKRLDVGLQRRPRGVQEPQNSCPSAIRQ